MVVVNCLDFILSEEEEEQTNKCQTTSSSSHLLLLLQQHLKLRLFKSFKSWRYAITTNNNNDNTDNNNNNTDTQPPFTPIEIISEIEHSPIANLCDIKISYNCQALIVSDFRWGKIHMFDLLTRKYLKPIYHYSAIPRTLPLCMCVEEESSPMNRFRANTDTQNYLIFTTHSAGMFKVHLSRGECMTQVWNREWDEFQTGELTIHYSKQQLGMNRILCCVKNVGVVMLNSNDGSLLSTFHQFYIPNNNGLYSSAMKSYDLNTQTIQLLDPFNLHSKITTAVVCCNSTIHLLEMKEITPNTAVVSGNNTNSCPYEWIEKNRFEIPQDHSSHASSSHTQTFKILLDREYGHVIVCSRPALVVSLQTGQVVARLRMNAHNGCLDEMHGVAFFNIDHKTIHVYD